MTILIRVIIGLVVLLCVLGLVGFLLPSQFKVERTEIIAASAEKIYPMIAETQNWPKWGVWSARDPNMKMTYAGPASGKGAQWSWQSKSEGNGAMEFTAAEANKSVTYRLSFADWAMVSTGTLSLTPEATGTRVTWTNEGDLGGNPFMLYFGFFMDRLVGKDFAAGLSKLKSIVEK